MLPSVARRVDGKELHIPVSRNIFSIDALRQAFGLFSLDLPHLPTQVHDAWLVKPCYKMLQVYSWPAQDAVASTGQTRSPEYSSALPDGMELTAFQGLPATDQRV